MQEVAWAKINEICTSIELSTLVTHLIHRYQCTVLFIPRKSLNALPTATDDIEASGGVGGGDWLTGERYWRRPTGHWCRCVMWTIPRERFDGFHSVEGLRFWFVSSSQMIFCNETHNQQTNIKTSTLNSDARRPAILLCMNTTMIYRLNPSTILTPTYHTTPHLFPSRFTTKPRTKNIVLRMYVLTLHTLSLK